MSTKNKKLFGGIMGVILLLAVGTAVFSWVSNRSIRKVTSLQQQLLAADELSPAEFNALKLQLMRTVDEMPREKVRELYAQIEESRRKDTERNIEEFHASTGIEREILMDKILAKTKREAELRGALRSDGVRTRRKLTKEDEERMQAARKIKSAQDAGEITEEVAREKFQALFAQARQSREGRQRPELSEEEKAAREQERKSREEFYTALKERADVIGVELNLPRGGRGGGARGGGGRRGGTRGEAGGGRGPGGGNGGGRGPGGGRRDGNA